MQLRYTAWACSCLVVLVILCIHRCDCQHHSDIIACIVFDTYAIVEWHRKKENSINKLVP